MPLCEKKHLGAILRHICNKCHVIKRGSHKLNTIASALQMLLILNFENGRLKTVLYGSYNKAHLYDSTTEICLLRWQINIELGYKSDESTSPALYILFYFCIMNTTVIIIFIYHCFHVIVA